MTIKEDVGLLNLYDSENSTEISGWEEREKPCERRGMNGEATQASHQSWLGHPGHPGQPPGLAGPFGL